jgi:hypothetical protein
VLVAAVLDLKLPSSAFKVLTNLSSRPEIVLGVLIVILCFYSVSGTLFVASAGKILLIAVLSLLIEGRMQRNYAWPLR